MTDTEPTTEQSLSLRTLRALRRPAGDGDVAPDEKPATPAASPSSEPTPRPARRTAPPAATAAKRRSTPATGSIAAREAPEPRGGRRLVVVSAVVAVLATAFAAFGAVQWWHAGHGAASTLAAQRDEVVLAARLDAAALNTLDYRNADAALSKWLSVSTGSVHDQFQQSRANATKLIAQAKTSTSSVVVDAAVSELDTNKGTAAVLVSMNVKKTPATGAATTSRNRYLVSMQRVDGVWKISDLQTVEVKLA